MSKKCVIDTGPLSHFARAGWLGVLRLIAPDKMVLIPDTVERELRGAVAPPWLAQVLDADWIVVSPVATTAELLAYSRYARRLVGDDRRNTGECGVLALAEVHDYVAVVDDRAGVKAGVAQWAIDSGRVTLDN